jgi:hypothetical protein
MNLRKKYLLLSAEFSKTGQDEDDVGEEEDGENEDQS